ncbi:MAG: hypothetical protein H6675_00165 [Dehalococcoidia bacterium]|nr:hypothetical protein [Dehalococcoidia bacterium]
MPLIPRLRLIVVPPVWRVGRALHDDTMHGVLEGDREEVLGVLVGAEESLEQLHLLLRLRRLPALGEHRIDQHDVRALVERGEDGAGVAVANIDAPGEVAEAAVVGAGESVAEQERHDRRALAGDDVAAEGGGER